MINKNLKDILQIHKNISNINLVVAGSEKEDILQVVSGISKFQGITIHLTGPGNAISQCLSVHKINIPNAHIHNIVDIKDMVGLASDLYQSGKPVILMKGNVTTAGLMGKVIKKEFHLKEDKHISHVALFEIPEYHKLLCITDVAMNITPDLTAKKSIIENAVEIMRKLGVSIPKVACLSAIEYVNPKIPSTLDAEKLKEMNKKGEIEGCIVEGPFGLDNAISKKSAQYKNIINDVAGDADIVLVPDLVCGNMLYKSLVYFARAKCAAVITGTKIPIVLTSRTDTYENKLNSLKLALKVLCESVD